MLSKAESNSYYGQLFKHVSIAPNFTVITIKVFLNVRTVKTVVNSRINC